jgi:hypothetical protein
MDSRITDWSAGETQAGTPLRGFCLSANEACGIIGRAASRRVEMLGMVMDSKISTSSSGCCSNSGGCRRAPGSVPFRPGCMGRRCARSGSSALMHVPIFVAVQRLTRAGTARWVYGV